MNAPIPDNEEERLAALRSLEILDTPSEQEYDDIVLLASQICGTPMSTITLIDEDRQWFKSKIGVENQETPRDISFCGHALLVASSEVMVVPDALEDVRFAKNPFVTSDPHIRFYAGAPLVSPDNLALGTLCVFDDRPRELSAAQIKALQALARQVSMKLELRRMSLLLQTANQQLESLSLTDDLTGLNNRRGFLVHAEQQLKTFRARRSEREMWLLMADVDYLKQINDTFGHQEGSEAIIKAGEILKKSFRESDIIARLGGDEFAVMIINAPPEVGARVVERVENSLAIHNATSEKPYELSISCGAVPIDFGDESSLEEILQKADEKMYERKNRRRA